MTDTTRSEAAELAATWLQHVGNDLWTKGHIDKHEAEEMGRIAEMIRTPCVQAEPTEAEILRIAKQIAPNNGDTPEIGWAHLEARGEHHRYIGLVRTVLKAARMPAPVPEDVTVLHVKQRDGWTVITSPQHLGLYVAHQQEDVAMADVFESIRTLVKADAPPRATGETGNG